MPTLLLISPVPLAGKTTIAVGLAQRFRAEGRSTALVRLDGDDHATLDSALFAESVDAADASEIIITEAPAGTPSGLDQGARVIVIASANTSADDLVGFCRTIGGSLAGVIVNRVPQKRIISTRASLKSAGVNALAIIPEDRVLAAPTLGEVAAALDAEVSFLDGTRLRPVDRPLIASISADPGQGYFSRHGATAVIMRSDKPDLQLAAINAGANCLIVTGDLPLLSYVLDRAAEDEIPMMRTKLDTIAAVQGIEALFGATPFAGGEAKLRRIDELLSGIDVSALIEKR